MFSTYSTELYVTFLESIRICLVSIFLYLYPNCLFFLILALMRTHEIFPGPFQDRKWSLLRRKLVKSATQRLGQNSKIDFYSCKNKQCFRIRFAQENSALKINLFKFEIFWLGELTILIRKSHFEMTLWIENDKIDSKMTIQTFNGDFDEKWQFRAENDNSYFKITIFYSKVTFFLKPKNSDSKTTRKWNFEKNFW